MRFNTKTKTKTLTYNLAGGQAHGQTSKVEFASILLTSFMMDQFYRSATDTMVRMFELMDSIEDKRFIAQTAIFARNQFGMRSVTHATAAYIAKAVKGERWTKSFFEKVVHRPDDMTEILSLYFTLFGNPKRSKHGGEVPSAVRKGFGMALQRLTEYQLAKYQAKTASVSLVDVINMVHPPGNDRIGALIDGTLPPAETWEVRLTKAGQEATSESDKARLKEEAWTSLIRERKLGYFALLRNLRNISTQAPAVLDEALEMLCDPSLVRKSLVLPFRFTTAYDIMRENRKIAVALNKALEVSMANVPRFAGRTLVVLDVSGSMNGRPADIGSLFAAVLVKSSDADMMVFSDRARYVPYNPLDSVTTIRDSFRFAAGGTNFHAIFRTIDKPYDRIILLSDMQGWVEHRLPRQVFVDYKRRMGADPFIYSFDLQGYGTTQFNPKDPKVLCLAGFSDKVLDLMALLESDKNAMLHEIEKVEL